MSSRRPSASRPQLVRVQTSPPASPTPKSLLINTSLHPSSITSPPIMLGRAVDRTRTEEVQVAPNSSVPVPVCGINPPTMQLFPTDRLDYELLSDRKLGSGRWSTVYLARPQQAPFASAVRSSNILTPPTTPTGGQSRHSWPSPLPEYYAVKVAAGRSSVKALQDEAVIFSYLSSLTGHEHYITPFHGYDTRNNAVIFTALPMSLEQLITSELARLDETARTEKIVSLFPHLARSLALGLAWLHAVGVVHADIKPANILLRPDFPLAPGQSLLDVPFTPVLTDFTSSFCVNAPDSSSSTPPALGGGTYDFLAPEHLSRPYPPPKSSSDVYALAVTLLFLLTGASPFRIAAGNRYRLLEMAKAGKPLHHAMQDPRSETRLRDVADELRRSKGIYIIKTLALGLQQNADMRTRAQEWCEFFL